jgi:mono/diheme cytochrome c family protein
MMRFTVTSFPKSTPVWWIRQRMVVTVLTCAVALAMAQSASVVANDDRAVVVDFNRDVRPILASHCWQCHGPDARARKAELRLDTRVSAYADRGGYSVINPGKPEQSKLITRITSNDADLRMPPPDLPDKKGLSEQQIELLTRWIKQGPSGPNTGRLCRRLGRACRL